MPYNVTPQHNHAPWFSADEPEVNLEFALKFCLCNRPRIKIFQFSQKNTPKTLALARTKRLNQHYKFLAEFQNTWHTELQSNIPPVLPSSLAMAPRVLQYRNTALKSTQGDICDL